MRKTIAGYRANFAILFHVVFDLEKFESQRGIRPKKTYI